MWITLDNRNARLSRATDDERQWLRDYLSFPDKTAFYRKGPRGDGRRCMYNGFTESFPAGFSSMVKKAALDDGILVEVVDGRVPPSPVDATADLAWLRDYQRVAVDKALTKTRGLIWLPTAAGKTEIAVGLTRSVDTSWLFLVHRTNLGQQAAERFMRRNAEHGIDLGAPGIIGEGQWDEGERLTCATFQTLAAALKNGDPRAKALLGRVGGLIIDEAHTLPADSFWGVAMACDAYYRIGVSGTPLARGDQKSVLAIAATGPVIYRVKAEVLIQAGVLARPKIRMATLPQTQSNLPTWQGVYGEKVVRSNIRNAKLVELAKRATKPALLFVKEVSHGKLLAKRLMMNGVRADFTWGSHSTDWRMAMVSQLTRGDLDVLVCSVVFQEGIDIPCLRSVIIGAGGASVIAALQRVGRGMRVERDLAGKVTSGGDLFEVYDIADKGNAWLEKHSNARRNAYLGESYEVIVEPPSPSSLIRPA